MTSGTRQWAAFHDALLGKGATIEFVDPKPDLPDLVFTANAAIVLDGKALLSRYRYPERKREDLSSPTPFTACVRRRRSRTSWSCPLI